MNGWMSQGVCVIIGAGIAGLVAARRLMEAGAAAVVLDKGAFPGGRASSRRAGDLVADHGAQYFRAVDPAFKKLVAGWAGGGAVTLWCQRLAGEPGDPGPCWRGEGGMDAIAAYLAEGLDLHRNTRAVKLELINGAWWVKMESDLACSAAAVLLTPPLPQALELLTESELLPPPALLAELSRIEYEPCLTVLARLDGPSRVPEPGGLVVGQEPIAWIADNRKKGVCSDVTVLTLQAGPQFSEVYWDQDDEDVARILLQAARRWIGASVVQTEVKRWRYARPTQTHTHRYVEVPAPLPLLLAGDAFGGQTLEGAALSGLAAAERLIELGQSSSTSRE